MKGMCDAWGGHCYSTATFVARNEWDGESFETCGRHLTWMLTRYPIKNSTATRFVVVPFNPNVELLIDNPKDAISGDTKPHE